MADDHSHGTGMAASLAHSRTEATSDREARKPQIATQVLNVSCAIAALLIIAWFIKNLN